MQKKMTELSEYEKLRSKNIAEKESLFEELLELKKQVNKAFAKPKRPFVKRIVDYGTRPKSRRLQNQEVLQQLKQELVEARTEIAASLSLHPKMVVSDKVITELVTVLPSSKESLRHIEGFSDKKIDKFGQGFLSAISRFVKDNPTHRFDNLTNSPGQEYEMEDKFYQRSVVMYKRMKSLELVAKERNIHIATVANHLAMAIQKAEEVDLHALGITPGMITAVEKVCQKINQKNRFGHHHRKLIRDKLALGQYRNISVYQIYFCMALLEVKQTVLDYKVGLTDMSYS